MLLMRVRAGTAILGVLAGIGFMAFHIGFGLRGAQPVLAALMLVAEFFAVARGLGLVLRLAAAHKRLPESGRLQPSGREAGDVIIKVDGHKLGQVRSAIIGAVDVWGVGRVVLAGRRSDGQILELLAAEYGLIVVLERTPERAINAATRALGNDLVVVVDADQVLFPDVFTWCVEVANSRPDTGRVVGAYRIPTECHPDDAYGIIREVMSAKLGRTGAALCNASATVYQRRALIAAKGLRDGHDGGVVATTMALYRAGTSVLALPVPVSFQQTAPTARSVSHSRLIDAASWTRVFLTRLSPVFSPRFTSGQRLAAIGAAADSVAPIGTLFSFTVLVACLLSTGVPLKAPVQQVVMIGGAWVLVTVLARWLMFHGDVKPGDIGRGDFRAIGHTFKGILLGLFRREPLPLLGSGRERGGTRALVRHRFLLAGLIVVDLSVVARIAAQHTKRILTKVPRGQFLVLMAVAVFNIALMMSAAEFLMNRRQRRAGRRAMVGFDVAVDGEPGVSVDLSPDGIGFDVSSHYAPGSSLVVQFQLPDLHGNFRGIALSALVRDVWVVRSSRFGHRNEDFQRYRVGAAFGAMTAIDRDALIEYCRAVHPFDLARADAHEPKSRSALRFEVAPAARSKAGRLVRFVSWMTLISVAVVNLPPYSLAHAGPGNHTVAGQIFSDRNGNGKLDGQRRLVAAERGEAGIVVSAYDDGGWLVARTITDNDGAFVLSRLGRPVRIEAGPLPAGLYPSIHQADGIGLNRFVDPTNNDVRGVQIGVTRPLEYCQDNAEVVATCFSGTGSSFGGTTDAAGFVTAASLASGPGVQLVASQVVPRAITGPVLGLVHTAGDNSTYFASWASANSADGSRSRTTIYRRDSQGVINPFVSLPQMASRVASGPGTAGLGGMAMTADGLGLLVVDIDDNRVYTVPFATPDKSTWVAVPAAPSCGAGRGFPGAVAIDGGDVYLTVTCAQSATVTAAVFMQAGGRGEFDVDPVAWVDLANAPSMMTVATDRLTRHSDAQAGGWYEIPKSTTVVRTSTRRVPRTDANSATIALAALTDSDRASTTIQADIIANDEAAQFDRVTRAKQRRKLTLVPLAANAYSESDAAPESGKRELMVIGLAFDGPRVVLDVRDRWGRDKAATVSAPAAATHSALSGTLSTGNLSSGNTNAAVGPSGAESGLVNLQNHVLGAAAPLCDLAPTELGGVVWDDADGNGRHDPSELGLGGVTVRSLNADGDLLGTAITNEMGEYVFSSASTEVPKGNSDNVGSGVQLGKAVTIVVGGVFDGAIGGPLFGRVPSTGRALATVTVLQAGANILDVNFGYTRPRNSVGNRVGRDTNGDGILSDDEPGIAGVDVVLYEAENDAVPVRPIGRQTTDSNGYYQFNGVPDGLYVAAVSADNFGANQPLHGLVGSQLRTLDGAVVSKLVQLDAGNDANRARDVDFPMVPLTITVQVFDDVNRNGVFDPEVEKPFVGIHVTLATTGEPFDDVITTDQGIAVLAPNGRGKFTLVTHGFGRDITQIVEMPPDQSTLTVVVPFVGPVDLAAQVKAALPQRIGTRDVANVEIAVANVGTVVASGGATVVATLGGGLVVDVANLPSAAVANGATCTTDLGAIALTCVFDGSSIAPAARRAIVVPVVVPNPVPIDPTLMKVDVVVKGAAIDGTELSDLNNAASTSLAATKGGLALTVRATSPAALDASQPFTVKFNAQNDGIGPAGAGWLIAIPLDGFDVASAAGVGDQVKCELGNAELVCSDVSSADMAPGASRDVTVTLRPQSTRTIASTVIGVLRDGPAVRESTHPRAAVTVAHRLVDIAVESRMTPHAAVAIGDIVTITATVTNRGIDAASTGYSVEATIPGGTTFVDVVAPTFSCTPGASLVLCTDSSGASLPTYKSPADGRTMVMRVKVVAVAAGAQSQIVARPAAAESPEMVGITADSSTSNNASSVMILTTPHIDLGVTVADRTPAIHAVASRIVADVAVFNDGDTAAKPGYRVVVALPSNMTWASGTTEASSGFACTLEGNLVTCIDQGSVALMQGASRPLVMSFDVLTPAAGIETLVATVTPVAGDIGESNPLTLSDGSQNMISNNRFVVALASAAGRLVAGVVTLAGDSVGGALAGNSASGAVVVLESDGVEIKRATTNVAGGYVLAGISPMTAGVVTLVGTGLYLSAGKPSTAAVSADAADVLTADVTAVKTELQTIDEVVFSDRNADGMRSGGEPGVPGVAVELRSASGSSVGRMVTNALGEFRFTGLVPDNYRYSVATPPGFLQIPNTNSLALVPAAEASPIVGPVSGSTIELVDFAFIDANGDGIRQAGELPASGHSISVISADGIEVVTVPTDVNGKFVVRSADVPGGLQPGAIYEFHIVLGPEETTVIDSSTTIVTSNSAIAKHVGPAHPTLIPKAAVEARGLALSPKPTLTKINNLVSRVSLHLDPLAASIKAKNLGPIELVRDLPAGARLSDVSAEGWTCAVTRSILTCAPTADVAVTTGVLSVALVSTPEPAQRITRRAQLGATMGGVGVSASAFLLATILLYGVVRRWRQTLGSHGARVVS